MSAQSSNRTFRQLALHGVVPVITTPFVSETEEVDFDALKQLVDFAVAIGSSGICLNGYMSEFHKLSESERFRIVEVAVQQANGRVAVIAQSYHPFVQSAQEIARRNEALGADLISFTIPRIYTLGTEEVFDYCEAICRAVNVPVLIRDRNPGGPTVGPEFCQRLHETCPNFCYLKLEEPLMFRVGPKISAIQEVTEGEVGVLEGRSGLYVLDLLPYGICGSMPGLGVADVLTHVWHLGKQHRLDEAMDIFQRIVPQLIFGLQDIGLFLHLEKRLLVARGLLKQATDRRITSSISPELLTYGDFLNRRVLKVVADLKLDQSRL